MSTRPPVEYAGSAAGTRANLHDNSKKWLKSRGVVMCTNGVRLLSTLILLTASLFAQREDAWRRDILSNPVTVYLR